MNSKIKTNTLRLTTAAGLLLSAVGPLNAQTSNSVITFSVDMTAQIQNLNFTNGVNAVNVRGTFNGWGTYALTNNLAALNPNIYSGTSTDTLDANWSVMQYKYCIDSGGWESFASNRTWGLPTTSGGHLVLPTYYFNDLAPTNQTQVTNSIKFQVDMTQQIQLGNFIPGTSHVFARGSANNWGNDNTATSPFPLTNNPSAANTNIYTGVYLGPTSTEGGQIGNYGSVQFYKYYFDTGTTWESASAQSTDGSVGNRVYNLLQTTGALVLPVVYFSDLPPPVTNIITFQVDMSVQAETGNFDPNNGDYVACQGSFQGWTGGFVLTNRPAPGNTNVYMGSWSITNNPGTPYYYKFWDNRFFGNYENPSSTGGGSRTFNLLTTNGNIVLPDVLFSDFQLSDVLPSDTVVTFSVNMTGAVGTDAHVFNPGSDTVYINGDFLGWPAYNITLPALTNNPVGSEIYEYKHLFSEGSLLLVEYKYGINGTDNEAGFAQNHLRYIRTPGTYVLPTDKFGNQLSEPGYGSMSISQQSGGNVGVSWLGSPGIYLQTATNLTKPIQWTTVPGTAGLGSPNGYLSTNGWVSSTFPWNYPAGQKPAYFRWIKPATPPTP